MNKSFTFKKIIPSILIIAVLATGIFSVFGVETVEAINIENPPTTATIGEDYVVVEGVVIRSAKDPKGNKIKPADYAAGKTLLKGTTISTYKKEIPKFGSSLIEGSINSAGSTTGSRNAKETSKGSCTWYWWSISGCVNWIMTIVGQAVLGVLALFVGIAGWLLDYVVTYTVLEMGANVNGVNGEGGIGFIEDGWKTFRDLANIVIIFALLVIGIATILRYEGYGMKKLLGMLIVVALLINFSLFFTQIIIDSSNLLALQFYNKILAIHGGGGWTGIGYAYMDAFKLTTIFNAEKIFDPATLTKSLAFHQIFLVSALGSVVYLVAIFTFLAGAFLLIGRFVALIFLMVLSPLAFVGMILPATQSYASKWWSALFKYAIFAPIYMILTWFVINVVTSDAFKKSIGVFDSRYALADVAVNGGKIIESLPIIMNFVLIIFFMMASLIIANQMGIAGSSAVMSWGKSARKWGQGVVGRNTVGRGSDLLRRKVYDPLQARAEKTRTGRVARRLVSIGTFGALSDKAVKGVFTAGEKAKFGSTESFKEESDTYKARRKEVQGVQKEIEQKKVFKKAASGTTLTSDDIRVIGEMKIKELEKVGIKQHLSNKNVAEHLSAEQLETITKSDEFTQQEIKNIRNARFEDIVDGVKNGNVNAIKSLRGLSDKEVEMLGDETLRDNEIIKGMSQSQIGGIKKSNKLNSNLKSYILREKTAIFNAMTDPQLEAELRSMKPTDVSKVDSTIAIKPAASRAYSPAVLIELAKELKVADRATIKTNIARAVTVGTATQEQIDSHEWLNNPRSPSGVIF